MSYELLISELKKIPREELRSEQPAFIEIVAKTSDLLQVQTVLKGFFGDALKPAGVKPSAEAQKIALPHGGIQENQTLYYANKDKQSYYAMIWPWGNGRSATVKVMRAG